MKKNRENAVPKHKVNKKANTDTQMVLQCVDNNILTVKNVSRIFPLPEGNSCQALTDVSMTIPKGALTILKGRSGSGKTTLLNSLSALDMPSSGEILIGDQSLTAMAEEERELLRRYQFGFVFQTVALVPIMSAYENIDFVLRLANYQGNRDARIKEVLRLVGLESRMNHMPGQMSGGEQQRVGIARAIAHKPQILFADEPTGALDTASGLMVVRLFLELIEKEGLSIVMTTHDPNLMELGQQVYELSDGQVIGEWNRMSESGM